MAAISSKTKSTLKSAPSVNKTYNLTKSSGIYTEQQILQKKLFFSQFFPQNRYTLNNYLTKLCFHKVDQHLYLHCYTIHRQQYFK